MKNKLKTNSSIAKRFKKTKSGKLKRAKAFKNHILTKKSSGRKARLVKTAYVDQSVTKKLSQLIQH